MKEISEIPWNGYNVVSTFSGGGGSCLGYEMVGYKVVWANEFVPEAQVTYRANHPDTFLNCSDIREISPDDVIRESGIPYGEIDLFDGSPPCASFSTSGKRDEYWGKVKDYSATSQVVDDLFFEYSRLVKGLQPKTFVAENVSGLVKGKAKGYFKLILQDLKSAGYQVKAKLLNSYMLGVPQRRERLIFIGVRNDLCEKYGVEPSYPSPEKERYTFLDAVEGLEIDEDEADMLRKKCKGSMVYRVVRRMPKNPEKVIRGSDFTGGSYFNMSRISFNSPVPTFMSSDAYMASGLIHPNEDRRLTIGEVKRITSLPDDFVLTGSRGERIERMGRMVPPVMMSKIAKTIETEILCKIQ